MAQNDLLATLLYNPELSIATFKDAGITADNTSFLSKDSYKNVPEIQQAFAKEDGSFDEEKFNNFYDSAKQVYNVMDQEFTEEAILKSFEQSDQAFWKSDLRESYASVGSSDTLQDYALNNRGNNVMSPSTSARMSAREIADTQKVWNSETQEWEDWTPNDKAGLLSANFMPTLVLAQYDEDETEVINGREITHHKGDYKLHNGKTYWETLGDRDVIGRTVSRVGDHLTVDGSWANKHLDFIDHDDVKASALKTAVYTVARTGMAFIPYVGTAWGLIGAANALNQALPKLFKALDGAITGTDDNEAGKAFNKWDAFAQRYSTSQSDYAGQHMFSLEGIGDMIGSTFGQLVQQRAIANIPRWLKMGGDGFKTAKIGREVSFAYMSLTSAANSYDDFIQAGANERTAGIAMLANMAALNKLMRADYFRDTLFKGSYMDESITRAPARNNALTWSKTLKGKNPDTPDEARTLYRKLTEKYYNELVPALSKTTYLPAMASEGTEEVLEELLSDSIKGVTSGLNALGIPCSTTELDFGFSGQDVFQRYATSFVGGALGGGLFKAHNNFSQWQADQKLVKKWGDVGKAMVEARKSRTDIDRLTYACATNKYDEIAGYYAKWHNKGLYGSTTLDIDGNPIEGTSNISANDFIYNKLMEELNGINTMVKSENFKINKTELDEIIKNGGVADYEGVENAEQAANYLRADQLVKLAANSNLYKRANQILTDIVDTKQKIEDLKKDLKPGNNDLTAEQRKAYEEALNSNKELAALNKKLGVLEAEKDSIITGQATQYFVGQGYFAAATNEANNNPYLKQASFTTPFVDIKDKDAYCIERYGLKYADLSADQQLEADVNYDYYTAENSDKVFRGYDVYLEAASRIGQTFAEGDIQTLTEDTTHEPITWYAQANATEAYLDNTIATLKTKDNLTEEEAKKLDEAITAKEELKRTPVPPNIAATLASKNGVLADQAAELAQLNATYKAASNDIGSRKAAISANYITKLGEFAKNIEEAFKQAAATGMSMNGNDEFNAFKRELANMCKTATEVNSYSRESVLNSLIDKVARFAKVTNDAEFTAYISDPANKAALLQLLTDFSNCITTDPVKAVELKEKILTDVPGKPATKNMLIGDFTAEGFEEQLAKEQALLGGEATFEDEKLQRKYKRYMMLQTMTDDDLYAQLDDPDSVDADVQPLLEDELQMDGATVEGLKRFYEQELMPIMGAINDIKSTSGLNGIIPSFETTVAEDGTIAKGDIGSVYERLLAEKAKLKSSPVFDILAKVKATIGGEDLNILDLIEKEVNNLASKSSLDQYIIANQDVIDALKVNDTLKEIIASTRALIIGAYSINPTINAVKGDRQLPVLTEVQANAMLKDLAGIESRIDTLLNIHDANMSQAMRMQKNVAIYNRAKWINHLTSISAEKLAVFGTDKDGKNLIDFNSIYEECGGNADMLKDLTEDGFVQNEKVYIAFEQRIFDIFNANDATSPLYGTTGKEKAIKMAAMLCELCGDKMWRPVASKLAPNNDAGSEVTPMDVASYLLTVTSLPATAFAESTLATATREGNELAPLYGQEFAVRMALAQTCNTEGFNWLLKLANTNDWKTLPEVANVPMDATWLEHKHADDSEWSKTLREWRTHQTALNASIILGGAGTGKSVGVAATYLQHMASANPEVIVAAPASTQVDNLDKNIKERSTVEPVAKFTLNDLFVKLFGKDIPTEFKMDTDTGAITLLLTPEAKANIFNSTSRPRILVVDEVGKINECAFKWLNDWAVANNVFIVGLGDDLQEAAFVKSNNNVITSGIEDCSFIKYPALSASMRAGTRAKLDNYSYLNKVLTELQEKFLLKGGKALNESELQEAIGNGLPLHYYESADGKVLYGDKILTDVADDKRVGTVVERANKFAENADATVAIITDHPELYSARDNIAVIDINAAQGGEWDYVILDADLSSHTNNNTLSLLKCLYTMSQRAVKGTVMLENPSNKTK